MTNPIIDPSTLTEEQREAIRKEYHDARIRCEVLHIETHNRMSVFEWLFGKDFFEKGDNNE